MGSTLIRVHKWYGLCEPLIISIESVAREWLDVQYCMYMAGKRLCFRASSQDKRKRS